MRSYVIPQHSRANQALLEITIFCFILSAALSCEVRSTAAQSDPQKLQRYQAILEIIDSYYVDKREVSRLFDSVFEHVFAALDPHSFCLDPQETIESRNYYFDCAEFGYGLGVVKQKDYYSVRSITPESPSDRAGLLSGDKIEKIEGMPIASLTEIQADYLLKNGRSVGLSVSRQGGKKHFDVRLVAAKVPEKTVGPSMMLDGKTGYVHLGAFITNTFVEFRDALRKLHSQGMQTLVLDLRDNGGGLLDVAHQCASLFLYSNSKLTALRSRRSPIPTYFRTEVDGEFRTNQLIILVDRNTASAGEVMSGILQDNDRGILVGQPTYGKGLVQQQFPLPDRGVFQMTTSRYLLPSGRCIQLPYSGDKYIPFDMPLVYGPNYGHRFDSLLPNSGQFYTEKGRRIYAGLGVVPDIITPPFNTSELLEELLDSGAFSYALDEYLNYNAELLKKKYDPISFASSYVAKSELLKIIYRKAIACGVRKPEDRIDKEQEAVLRTFKEYVSERLFGPDGRFVTTRSYDADLQEALRLVEQQFVLN